MYGLDPKGLPSGFTRVSLQERFLPLILVLVWWDYQTHRFAFQRLLSYMHSLPTSAAAASLQSCPTLRDPRDGSPPLSSKCWEGNRFSDGSALIPLLVTSQICMDPSELKDSILSLFPKRELWPGKIQIVQLLPSGQNQKTPPGKKAAECQFISS